jgi:tRNA(Arg) A34 adenosine deaminase TadA
MTDLANAAKFAAARCCAADRFGALNGDDPCPMCAGAIFNSHIDRLVIGASSHALMRLAGREPRSYSVEKLSKKMNVKLEVIRGVLQDQAEEVLAQYKWPKG